MNTFLKTVLSHLEHPCGVGGCCGYVLDDGQDVEHVLRRDWCFVTVVKNVFSETELWDIHKQTNEKVSL